MGSCNGAFRYTTESSNAISWAPRTNEPGGDGITFDGSLVNNKYGLTSSVQPQSLRLLIICRT